MSLIVVSGALANKPGNAGAAWTRLSWARGLERLGHVVYFVEQIAPGDCVDAAGARCDLEASVSFASFSRVLAEFGFARRSALVSAPRRSAGMAWGDVVALAEAADLLVNISGHLTLDTLKPRFRRRVFVDLDPGYTQYWHTAGLAENNLKEHHHYFTIGENIGTGHCGIPTGGISWRPTRQPVVLDDWPVAARAAAPVRFTTIASWRGSYGRVMHEGVYCGLKAHEVRKFLALPAETRHHFEIALDIHAADEADVERLRRYGWTVAQPGRVAGDPCSFRRYIQQSGAEFSVAQGVYVDTKSGWFSDRTVRYLASGKPVVVQDTGFGRQYPVGCGLLSFRTLAEAAACTNAVAENYDAHAASARSIAVEFFDSDKVLPRFLDRAGAP